MIHNLLTQIISTLRTGFAGVLSEPLTQVNEGPIPVPTIEQAPRLGVHMSEVTYLQHHRELSSSKPRPIGLKEELAVNEGNPAGPYQLEKTPLDTSVLCKVLFDEGPFTGRRLLFVEGKDFTINYQNGQLTFSRDLAGASTVFLHYSYVGVFTIREFEQTFVLDVYDQQSANTEKWASIATNMILSNHDELLELFNDTNQVTHVANAYLSEHSISQILPLTATTEKTDDGNLFKSQLSFKAIGQIRFVREIVGGFGLIEKIHSPGKVSSKSVDIDIDVE
ncbi:MAG: hypothetical protein AAFZ15_19980 [Bacteroidota bacterium]